ncbi:uracil-DNA glycosylase [Pseudoponticoccus marisrubri]|uniref:Uracil-DNA glycosylase n=1 Tax=Pseudoponticoccus marisrubri TaxID=1685382 RepID=A0A0W7WQE5_9RHOB|nr:uracil-DNA glycosylase [Pseudoponticoccus marisrubri]KUF12834.1 uracil-DNA glycosylase [Pseudoponticoccus marisrubri]
MTLGETPPAWRHLRFFQRDLPEIAARLSQEDAPVLPPAEQVFAALDACPPDRVRVVILGQDPYPTQGHAHGFAFSVAPGTRPLPRSLTNIFREMTEDLGACPPDGDLRFWAPQGVLLLNTALTVPAGRAGGHARLGWSRLTEEVLATLSDRPRAFLLWGNHAQGFARHITGADHLVLRSAHPSPLSARRGFFGSRPFSRINDWLKARGDTPINWTVPPHD